MNLFKVWIRGKGGGQEGEHSHPIPKEFCPLLENSFLLTMFGSSERASSLTILDTLLVGKPGERKKRKVSEEQQSSSVCKKLNSKEVSVSAEVWLSGFAMVAFP